MRSVRSIGRQEGTKAIVPYPSVRRAERVIPITDKGKLSAESSHDGKLGECALDGETLLPRSKLPIAHSGVGKSQGRLRFGRPSYPCCSTEDVAMRTFDPTPLWRSTVGF